MSTTSNVVVCWLNLLSTDLLCYILFFCWLRGTICFFAQLGAGQNCCGLYTYIAEALLVELRPDYSCIQNQASGQRIRGKFSTNQPACPLVTYR